MKSIYLSDKNIPYEEAETYFKTAAEWAEHQCKSFIRYYVQDVSDVSYEYDHVAEYQFRDVKDAIWFELKWR